MITLAVILIDKDFNEIWFSIFKYEYKNSDGTDTRHLVVPHNWVTGNHTNYDSKRESYTRYIIRSRQARAGWLFLSSLDVVR